MLPSIAKQKLMQDASSVTDSTVRAGVAWCSSAKERRATKRYEHRSAFRNTMVKIIERCVRGDLATKISVPTRKDVVVLNKTGDTERMRSRVSYKRINV